MEKYLDMSPEVRAAMEAGQPVLAMETAMISHGMPYPSNVETALAVHDVVRRNGAVPAAIGIISGRMKVGLTDEEIEYLAKGKNVRKVSRRDLPYVLSSKLDGATTVAGAMIIAQMAGIRIFMTGGIGGVHRGACESFDISSDLDALKTTDVAVVCAGVNSIFDVGATLEYLETAGVPVITVGTDDFPAFYSRRSGFKSSCRIDSPKEIAELVTLKYSMGIKGGVLIGCPIPMESEIPYHGMQAVIEEALQRCRAMDISGNRITPFLLDEVKTLTAGNSLDANIKLLLNNAAIVSKIAAAL